MKTLLALIPVALWVAAIVGWVVNLVDVVQIAAGPDTTVTTLFIVKCVGVIVAPLGAVMGLFF